MNIVCLSHLRWDFVFQRPQHLLSRAGQEGRVLYVEEPIFANGSPRIEVTTRPGRVHVVVPSLPPNMPPATATIAHRQLIECGVRDWVGDDYVLWYYTPMALPFADTLSPAAVVYDCMDELSAFAGAPRELGDLEQELFKRADLVFTGGQSLFEAKRRCHANVHAFPSSVDVSHFCRAREACEDPVDQRAVPGVRLGFFGVIDERMDYPLLTGVADARPDWHVILVGPVTKVDPSTLPRASNIHYLGAKSYGDLPSYIAGWDVAIMPFARNAATRFISPTKTPEYLAAGKPVVSTSIRDVVRPYGELGLTRIADTVSDFIAAVEASLTDDARERVHRADAFLAQMSWDATWVKMKRLITQAIVDRDAREAVASRTDS